MRKRLVNILISCVFAASVAGCATSSPSRFYKLSPMPVPADMPQANYSVTVGPVSVPAVVDRPQIIMRSGPHQVSIDEFHRWASPLKNDIARVIV